MSGISFSLPSLPDHHKNHAITHLGIQVVGQITWYVVQAGSIFTSSITGNDHLAITIGLIVLGLGVAKKKDWLKW